MANLTLSIPEDLNKKMKKHKEIKWSEVVRKALAEYINKIEIAKGEAIPSEKLANLLKDNNLDTTDTNLEKAIEHYEKSRNLEWKRLPTTPTNS